MTWELANTKQAQKDAKKLVSSGLKQKAQDLLARIAVDPYLKPPPLENLIGCLFTAYQHSTSFGLPSTRRPASCEGAPALESLRIGNSQLRLLGDFLIVSQIPSCRKALC
ncbi:hypothetical protein LCGC14_0088590 [marine sediment metagenome]|uniref:Uncharacterized protein n=1 Tax=marine sediment metagenome TaxID=412755 RepID=A0A0F9VIU7_9ZZZZ